MTTEEWNDKPTGSSDERADLSSPLGAVVTPLVWHTYDAWTHWAESTSGTYRVQERNGVWRTSLLLPQTEHIVYEYDADDTTPADFEAAQLAAQADHESRILAALQPPTHAALLAHAMRLPEVAAMVEALTALIERYDEVVTTPDCSCSQDDHAVMNARRARAALEVKP